MDSLSERRGLGASRTGLLAGKSAQVWNELPLPVDANTKRTGLLPGEILKNRVIVEGVALSKNVSSRFPSNSLVSGESSTLSTGADGTFVFRETNTRTQQKPFSSPESSTATSIGFQEKGRDFLGENISLFRGEVALFSLVVFC
jgi:hypothetical protein